MAGECLYDCEVELRGVALGGSGEIWRVLKWADGKVRKKNIALNQIAQSVRRVLAFAGVCIVR